MLRYYCLKKSATNPREHEGPLKISSIRRQSSTFMFLPAFVGCGEDNTRQQIINSLSSELDSAEALEAVTWPTPTRGVIGVDEKTVPFRRRTRHFDHWPSQGI